MRRNHLTHHSPLGSSRKLSHPGDLNLLYSGGNFKEEKRLSFVPRGKNLPLGAQPGAASSSGLIKGMLLQGLCVELSDRLQEEPNGTWSQTEVPWQIPGLCRQTEATQELD